MPWPHTDELAGSLVPYLLPYLVNAWKTVGTEALKGVGHKLGDKANQALQELWLRIRPELETKPTLKTVTEKLAESPENHGLRDELRRELQNLLEKDPEFTREISDLLDRVIAVGVVLSNVEIEMHGGKMEGIVVDDLRDLSKSGIREIRADTRIQETKEGSATIGVRIGRLGTANNTDEE